MNRITDDILNRVEKPVRYIGGEFNSIVKDKNSVDIRVAFCFPDIYEVGMSHLGSKILYHTMNLREDTYCERCYAPWVDMEEELRKNNIPLFTLETKDPLNDFDFLMFTLQYEMSYTNILNMLNMSNIALRASERKEEDPIVLMGGPCAYNPESLYDIADLFSLGEGEDMLDDVLSLYKECRKAGKSKKEFLREASKIQGIYVPSLYEVAYNEDGTIKEFKPKYDDVPQKIKKRIIQSFDKVPFPEKLIVPYTEIVHDRVTIEAFRGCTRGCRFCQAGMVYRPVREKTTETLLTQAEASLKATGYDETSMISLSTCDYSDINNLLQTFMKKFENKKVGISLPSIRVDAFSVDLMKEIQKVRKSGLTLAPEAGSQRMRDVINKNVTEENILEATGAAFREGWSKIKLYFVIGLPYENVEDVVAIGDLASKICDEYYNVPKEKRNKGLQVTVSTSILVPKPFTPFQWAAQERIETVREKISALRANIKKNSIKYNWHESEVSLMEAIVSRGDRRLCDVIVSAYENGAKFDGWGEYFKFNIWNEALEKHNIDPNFYVYRERSYDEVLPWDFIDIGVTKEYLIKENEKAKIAATTPDCREGCTGCGVNVAFGKGACFEGALFNKVH